MIFGFRQETVQHSGCHIIGCIERLRNSANVMHALVLPEGLHVQSASTVGKHSHRSVLKVVE